MRVLRAMPLLTVLACGGATRSGVAVAELASPAWNAGASELLERYGGIRHGDRVSSVATVEGREANLVFRLAGDGRRTKAVLVTWDARFAAMDECASLWRDLRQRIDAALGASSSDNLAATWQGRGSRARLACDPDDLGQATLTLSVER